jgi:guanine nucleotide-binding protein subunit alpha
VDSSDLRRIEFSLKPLAVIESKLHELLQPASRNDESDEEVAVRASDRWKRVLSRSRLSSPSATEGSRRSTDTGATLDGEDPWNKVNMSPDDSSRILEASKDDIISLWENETVQEVLRKHKVGLELRSGL